MSEGCTHDCSSCSADCGSREQTNLKKELAKESSVKHVIAVMSGKGGVGKSLVTSLLACEAARKGYRVGILDGDITGPSIPASFGLHEKAKSNGKLIFPVKTKTGIDVMSINLLLENETDPVVWRGPIIGGVIQQFWTDVFWKDIDFLFVDMPPGTGDAQLTLLQSLPISGIVTVATPQELVGMIVEKAMSMANMMKVPLLGIVENMSYIKCPNCDEKIRLFGKGTMEKITEKFNVPVLGEIPLDPSISEKIDEGKVEDVIEEPIQLAFKIIEDKIEG